MGWSRLFDTFNIFGLDDDSKSNLESWQKPTFQEDPDYRKMQDWLSELGINITKGDIPEYYKSIGETGGAEFEQQLGLQNRDISQSMLEGAALTGRRGGGVQQMIGQAVAENTAKNRWADYARSLVGKESLLKTGIGVSESARAAGQEQGSQKNQFNLNASQLEMRQLMGLDDYSLKQGEAEGQAFSGMLDLLLKGGVGFATGGPMGAAAAITGLGDLGDISSIFGKAKATITPQVAKLPKATMGTGMIRSKSSLSDLLGQDFFS